MPRGEEFEKTKDYSEKKSVGKPEGESVSFQFLSSPSVVKLSTSMSEHYYNNIKTKQKGAMQCHEIK